MDSSAPALRWVFLLAVGVCAELVYLLYFLRSFPLLRYYRADLDLGGLTNHTHAAFIAFIGLFTLLFALAALGWWLVHGHEGRLLLWLVLGFGGIFAVTMVFVYPITAVDIYSYVDESRIMVHYHQNPIFIPPSHYSSDPLMSLAAGWENQGAPYGPIGLVVDALPALVFGGNLLANLIALKLLFSAMALACAWIAYLIVRRSYPNWAVGAALLVAWNPLVLFEVSANGHNDIVMMSFALLAFLSFAHDEFLLGMLLLVASVLVKVATLVFLPLFLIYALARHPDWRSRSIYFLSALCGAALLALVAYVPFWQGIDTVRASLAGNERYVQSFSTVLYSLGPGLSLDQATLLGRLLFVPVYAFALWLASRGFAELTRASFIAALGLLCLAVTNFKVWYGLLAVMVAALVPRLPERLSGLLFAGGASVSAAFYAYLWWWGGLQNGSSLTFADNLAFFVTFLPAAYALVYLSTSRPWRSEASTVDRPATPSGTASGVG